MSDVSVSQYAERVAHACGDAPESPKFGGILEIITIVLPILMQLPCFKSSTAEQAQAKIEAWPGFARMRAKALIRQRAKTAEIRQDAGLIADNMLAVMAESSKAEFAAVYASCRGPQ